MTRSRAEGGRPGRLVSLSNEGRRLVDRLMRVHMANEAAILSALDDTERQQLASLLGKLLVSVEADRESARPRLRPRS